MSKVVALDLLLVLAPTLARAAAGAMYLGDGRDVSRSESGGGRGEEDERDEEGQEPGAPLATVEYRHGFGVRCGFVEVSAMLLRGGVDLAGFCAFFVRWELCSFSESIDMYLRRLHPEFDSTMTSVTEPRGRSGP